ncbi:MAG: DNA primase small subunit domain-containing protein [Candidatus Diapherotrites archaeon]
MSEKENLFLKNAFRSYYEKKQISILECAKREFGIGDFGKKIVKRHMSFSNENELNLFLRKEVPPYISYSAAYYEKPSARPMDSKGFLGADLVYEFDADDIETKCKEKHDFWQCSNEKCNASGKGAVIECPKCGSGVKTEQWFCKECLDETKKQALRLIELLSSELGFSEGISVNFSGKAGYHLHVRNSEVKGLSQQARTELIDYLTLNGIDLEAHGFGRLDMSTLSCPVLSQSSGIAKRFMERLVSFIRDWNPEKLAVHGNLNKKQSAFLVKNRKIILEKMSQGILFPIDASKPETSQKFWHLLIEEALREESIALNIDRQTSIDIHKILRVPDSIHGGTGLIAKTVSLDELKAFDPFKEAVAFFGTPVKVFINKAPEFSLGGERFKAFEQESQELSLSAAIFLVAAGKAVLE